MILGVVSDTHGFVAPSLPELLREAGVEGILHAGDVGSYSVLSELEEVAPVTAVRGNVDREGPLAQLPGEVRLSLEGLDVYMSHIGGLPAVWLPRLPRPLPAVAICGHSHIPLLDELGGVLFLNPGSAGTGRRFGRPASAAILNVSDGIAGARLVTL
jgi:uncharacterized protein